MIPTKTTEATGKWVKMESTPRKETTTHNLATTTLREDKRAATNEAMATAETTTTEWETISLTPWVLRASSGTNERDTERTTGTGETEGIGTSESGTETTEHAETSRKTTGEIEGRRETDPRREIGINALARTPSSPASQASLAPPTTREVVATEANADPSKNRGAALTTVLPPTSPRHQEATPKTLEHVPAVPVD